MFPPRRIVCLTEETVETLYLLGEQDRIVGVSGYVVRPPAARREKPRVSAFTSADTEKILALGPDLVFTFSDLQAGIVSDLIRHGLEVHAFNHRTVAGIFAMIRTVGAIVGADARAQKLVKELKNRVEQARERSTRLRRRPRIFFEEWDDPLISAIGWVSELIGVAGGDNVFPAHARNPAAKDRIVSAEEVIAARPDIIIGSLCGKKFRAEKVAARPGFSELPAVRNRQLHEIKSSIILQPGPAALTDGLDALEKIICDWAE